MRQFFKVLSFEFSNYSKSKMFIGITVALMLIIGVLLSWPRISELFEKEGGEQPSGGKPTVFAVVNDVYQTDELLQSFKDAFPGKDVIRSSETEAELKAKVDGGEYAAAVVVKGPLEFSYITQSIGIYENPAAAVNEIVKRYYQMSEVEKLGLSRADAAGIVAPGIAGNVIETGKSQIQNFFYTYILIFSLYMAILLYGQFVATGVASEKGTRTMELLITSAKPMNLLFGKVIGSGLAGLTQFVLIFGSAFLFYNLNADLWAGSGIIQTIFAIPLEMLLFVLLFFILGYFLYAFMYGALGSLASRTEDVNTSIMPVTFLFIAAFFVVVFSMNSGNVDSPLMVVCSYLPFTSPMAMFTRIAMGNVSNLEIVISVAVMVLATYAVGSLSAAIYRVGILMYGKPPKLGALIKTLKENKI